MNPVAPSYTRAYLLVEGGERLQCWFNPTTLDRSRRAEWTYRPAYGQGAPKATYRGGREEGLTLNLLLHAESPTDGARVRNAIDRFFRLLDPAVKPRGRQQSRPRTVRFVWGKFISFTAACESVAVNTELFDADGTPLRATVTLVLRQYSPSPEQATAPAQNPTTKTTSRARAHRLKRDETLHSVAFEHYGDPGRWRDLARHNEIDDPLAIKAGDQILVPLEDGA